MIAAGERLHADLYPAGVPVEAPVNAPELLILQGDGSRYRTNATDRAQAAPSAASPPQETRIPTTEDDGLAAEERDRGWRENKIAVVVRALPGKVQPDGEYTPPEELVKTYVATTGPQAEFERDLEIEAHRRGVKQAQEVVAVSDNGHGLPALWARLCVVLGLTLKRITDFYHCAKRLAECAQLVKGEGAPHQRERQRYFQRLRALLWDGQVKKVIAILRVEAARLAPQPKQLRELAGQPVAQARWAHVFYFEKYQDTMDYPAYRAKGWPLGSGTVESACAQFGARVKHGRMRWTPRAADALHVIKAAILSGDDRWARRWPPPIPVLELPADAAA